MAVRVARVDCFVATLLAMTGGERARNDGKERSAMTERGMIRLSGLLRRYASRNDGKGRGGSFRGLDK